ncbi:FHA domain-containing protein [Oerskovia sp. Sa1BUA8]|uniref:FHA domain-containing protein n=1 Tax=Oerskovia douganii TaxID=2762210 RepID=A0A9D5U7H1_9CELL|nr:FHA domain-containing protein [Oerskovia douganii]MBE7699290.1 FHA domain-containing protein [Oerskovia douganii]
MRLRYDTGSAFGFVRGGAIVILPEGASNELVGRLWDGLDTAGEAEIEVIEVIQLLTVVLGATLRTMPPFAVAVTSEGRAQVAVRGQVSVTLRTSTASVHVDGDDVSTWSERLVEDVEEVSVQLGVDEAPSLEAGPGQVALVGLPLHEGVVLASRILRDLVGAPVARPPEVGTDELGRPEPAPAAGTSTPAPVHPHGALAPGSTTPALVAWSEPVALADGDPAPVQPDAHVPAEDGEPAPPQPDPRLSTESFGASFGAVETIISLDTALERTVAPDGARGAAEAVEDGYGHLWESTVLRAVEDAAVRIDEDEDEEHATPGALAPAPVTEAAASVSPAAPVEPPAQVVETAASCTTLIDGIPREWAGTSGDPVPVSVGGDVHGPVESDGAAELPVDGVTDTVDHDGHTVFSSVIADLRAQVAGVPNPVPPPVGPTFTPPPPPGAQQILARACPDDHPNPPSRDVCGVCGAPLHGDARLVTRPSLGRIVLSTGQVVELDRPVVLGRRPRTTRAQSNDLPRLVAVPSPEQDISRSHLEIQLEGWHVLVCDLSTTNGTTLLRPGQPPRRLHPGEPTMVASHDVVDVGDGVTFVLEGLL